MKPTTIHTLLIANRCEIASRIIASAHAMGIKTVAVYSAEDAHAPYVTQASAAYRIPGNGAPAYLNGAALIALAHKAGAVAIHPGYGFLAENASFAQHVIDAGLVWIGPQPGHIAAMGDKAAARTLAATLGVPTVPGAHVNGSDPEAFSLAQKQALSIGFPLLLKAALGGGGKAMRLVRTPDAFETAWRAVCSEAVTLFNSCDIVLEKYIERARHIEVQIAGDGTNIVHFFERECTVQRRHQKILEETPCNFVSPATCDRMYAAACTLADAINYDSVGTIEFIVTPTEDFYFLEMNTRLQVEHAITELTCGIDLVRLQIDLACGKPLPLTQHNIARRGHAIECRITAETAGFMPSCGTIEQVQLPSGPFLRIDHNIHQGLVVSPFFDSMIGKYITVGATRAHAIEHMRTALEHTSIRGITTNIETHRALLQHHDFLTGAFYTRWLEEQHPTMPAATHAAAAPSSLAAIAALLVAARTQLGHTTRYTTVTAEPRRNWRRVGWL